MKTWGTLKSEIKAELNIEDELFVSDDELLTWANDAKDEAEAEIISLYDRYLETEANISFVQGTSAYSLPADIYAAKITGMYFDDGSESYEIKFMKNKADILRVNDADRYLYRVINSTALGQQLKFYPTPRETSSSAVTVHYIRESAAITEDDDYMDIPIADAFIKQYVKDKVREKEVGPMQANGRSALLEKQKQLLIESLTQMVPDDSSDELQPDLSFYDDMGEYYV